jgi:GT2 family glycosyltransferase
VTANPLEESTASRLSRDLVLITLRLPAGESVHHVDGVVGRERKEFRQECIDYTTLDGTPGQLVVAAAPGVAAAAETLAVAGDRGTEGVLAFTELQTLMRRELAGLERRTRTALLAFVTAACARAAVMSSAPLERSLALLRDGLRERLPALEVAAERPVGLVVDQLLASDETGFLFRGWLHDPDDTVVRVTAVAPTGARMELTGRMWRHPRPDVDAFYRGAFADATAKTGFTVHVELPAPCRIPDGWIVELETATGNAFEKAAPSVIADPASVRDALLALLSETPRHHESLMRDHLHPAFGRVQRRITEAVEVESIAAHGTPPEDPEISIVVPLHGRIDLLELQLAEFANDSEIARSDLVYVLDSPELEPALRDMAAQLFPIYRLPFRVAFLSRPGGYAAANNAAVALARGRLLVLLNSDVFPSRPGWLERMAAFHDETPDIGALGPKLLFEDDSLQHAGIRFDRGPASTVWENAHYFKGLHRTLPAANVTRPVPAVTGACLMIGRELYERFGGLSGEYVRGDYEDSDLCLRLLEAGFVNWYLPEVELYHLEGQSYDRGVRALTFRYNTWLHTHKWRRQIEAIAVDERYEAAPLAEGTGRSGS